MDATSWACVGGLLGLLVGSFLALVTWRWPRGETITGRSHCDGCGVQLRAWELVPLLSFAMQRGRCRPCGSSIAARHPVIEVAAAAVGATVFGHWAPSGGLAVALAVAVVGWWLLTLILLDVEHQWLPDALTLPGIGLALLVPSSWPGFPALEWRLWGATLGFVALWSIGYAYRRLRGRDGLGGGDPKLLAGLGALFGAWVLPLLVTGAAALGLLLAGWDRVRGRVVTTTTRLPLGALLAGMGLVLLGMGPGWQDMIR